MSEEIIAQLERSAQLERIVAVREAGLFATARVAQRGEDPLVVLVLNNRKMIP